MDSYGAWRAFAATGRIEDYLTYRQETENRTDMSGNDMRAVWFEGMEHEGELREKDEEWKTPLW